MTLHDLEIIRRFLSQDLPDGFVRVRHFGLHHSSCRAKLQLARRVLGLPFELPAILKLKFLDWFKQIMGSDDDPRNRFHFSVRHGAGLGLFEAPGGEGEDSDRARCRQGARRPWDRGPGH